MKTVATKPNEDKINFYALKIERAVLKTPGCSARMIDELFESEKINQRESRELMVLFCGD